MACTSPEVSHVRAASYSPFMSSASFAQRIDLSILSLRLARIQTAFAWTATIRPLRSAVSCFGRLLIFCLIIENARLLLWWLCNRSEKFILMN